MIHPATIRWIWICYWCVLFVIMHVPAPEDFVPSLLPNDKVLHFSSYFALAFLGGLNGRSGFVALAWLPIYLAYAGLDEWLQQFVGRSCSWEDWLADSAGVVTATWLVWFLKRRKNIGR